MCVLFVLDAQQLAARASLCASQLRTPLVFLVTGLPVLTAHGTLCWACACDGRCMIRVCLCVCTRGCCFCAAARHPSQTVLLPCMQFEFYYSTIGTTKKHQLQLLCSAFLTLQPGPGLA